MDIGEIFEMTQGTILKSDLIQVITADSNTLKDYDLSLDLTTITHISDVADYLIYRKQYGEIITIEGL